MKRLASAALFAAVILLMGLVTGTATALPSPWERCVSLWNGAMGPHGTVKYGATLYDAAYAANNFGPPLPVAAVEFAKSVPEAKTGTTYTGGYCVVYIGVRTNSGSSGSAARCVLPLKAGGYICGSRRTMPASSAWRYFGMLPNGTVGASCNTVVSRTTGFPICRS